MNPVPQWIALHAAEGLFTLKQRPGEGLCVVKGCCNRHGRKKAGLCDKHHQSRWRMKSPKRSAYAALRDHAKARRIEFSLSPEYLDGMLDVIAYWDHEAETRGDALSIDRIDPTKGYIRGNVRVITISQNVAEGNRARFLPEYVQHILERKRERAKASLGFPEREDDEERNPF